MRIEGKRFLVTGGSGFIGSHVVERLAAAGAEEVVVFDQVVRGDNLAGVPGAVRILQGDVTRPAEIASAMEGVEGVFHLAVLPLGPTLDHPRLGLEVNVVGTFNVLEAASEAGVRKVVFSSASSVYGDTDATMDETHPLNARTMYGASKVAGEYLVRAFADRSDLDYVTLRYMNVYGPRQHGGLVMGVLERLLAGERPVISGDGSQSFDFVHVADVADANLRAMEADVTAEELNVGSGTEASVREIVERLIELTGVDVEPLYRRDDRVLTRRRVGSSEKAERLLGWRASRDLERGLRDVVEAARRR